MAIDVDIPNGWHPRDYQLKAWTYLERGGTHCELTWHRRSGKDDLALHWTAVAANDVGAKESIGRIGNYWHMLPQANQARKALWNAVNPHTGHRRIDEAFPHAIRAGMNDSEMMIRFKSGSSWQVVGSDNFNSLVGSPPIGMVFSEWPLCDPASWAYLMPIIEENGGWAIFNGTPRGKNHAYRSLNAARNNPKAFAQILSAEHTGVFTPEQLERIRLELVGTYGEEYGQAVFDQEYGCSFEAANLGAILGRWLTRLTQQGKISDAITYDPAGAAIEISSDIGRRDSSAWWFWQPAVGGFRIVDHDRDSGLDADEWCDRLAQKIQERGYRLGHVNLPHDARAKTFSAKHSAVEIFVRYFGQDKVRIIPNGNKEDKINAARRVLRSCAFHETNTERGRDGLSNWSYEYDEEQREFSREPRHDWASHDGDAFAEGATLFEEQMPPVKVDTRARILAVGEVDQEYARVTLEDMWREHERNQSHRTRI